MHTQYLDNLDGLNRQKQVQEAGTNPFILIMQAPVKFQEENLLWIINYILNYAQI